MRKIKGLVLSASLLSAQGAWAALPELPRAYVDTDAMPAVTGQTFTVNAGQSIQTAINNAAAANDSLTHEIVIQAGATFNENLTLPNKGAGTTGWIIVRTSNLAGIAAQRQRIIPTSHAAAMPKIQIASGIYGVETQPGAHHYRFIGIEFIRTGGNINGVLLAAWVGSGSAPLSSIPQDFVIDRCILRTTASTYFVVTFQTIRGAIIDSYVSNNNPYSGDSTAIWMFNTPGPMKIVNNELASQGITIMNGAATYVSGYRPEDVEFRHNRVRANTVGGTTGKNTMEWKGGLRYWVAGNIFEDDMTQGQAATIVLTPRPKTEAATDWIDDITFEYNLLRRVKNVFALSGGDAGDPDRMSRVAVRHNYIDPADRLGGTAFLVGNGTEDMTLDHNTIVNSGEWVNFNSVVPPTETNWIARNNIASGDAMSAGGGPFTFGTSALNLSAPGRIFSKNVMVGTVASYTGTDASQNYFPGSVSLNSDGSLPAGSPYKNQATDATDIGADFAALYGAASGIGRFGTGPNDFYAYTGQWPVGPADATPPSVSLTAPANGATISGTVSVTATAGDNVGVAGVQFKLDGDNLGVESTSPPYSTPFNSTLASNGSHTLTAVARDGAGNQTTSAGVTVTVSNAPVTMSPAKPRGLRLQ